MNFKKTYILFLTLFVVYFTYTFYQNFKNFIPNKESIKSTFEIKNSICNAKNINKKEIVKIIEETLDENPQIIINALEGHVNKQQNTYNAKLQQKVINYKSQLLNNNKDPKHGNINAKNIFIIFYDYNCIYCKKMSKVLKQIIDNKLDIYFIFKELPILGNDSFNSSKISLELYKIAPNKFLDFHFALMEDYKNISLEQKIKNICALLNIDASYLYKEAFKTLTEYTIQQNFDIAKGIGFKSTPTIIINDQLIPGTINYNQIVKIIT